MKKRKIEAIIISTLLFLLVGCVNIPVLGKNDSDNSKILLVYDMYKNNEEFNNLLDDENGAIMVARDEKNNSMEITCQFYDMNYIITTELNPPYGDYYMTDSSKDGSDNIKIYMEYNDDIVNIYFYNDDGNRAEEPFIFKKKWDSRDVK